MEPIKFEQANGVMRKPDGMANCEDLPVHFVADECPSQPPVGIVSCWKPTTEELSAIARHRRVWLWVYGNGMPPVSLMGTSPFAAEEAAEHGARTAHNAEHLGLDERESLFVDALLRMDMSEWPQVLVDRVQDAIDEHSLCQEVIIAAVAGWIKSTRRDPRLSAADVEVLAREFAEAYAACDAPLDDQTVWSWLRERVKA